jgi:hypothetical protein
MSSAKIPGAETKLYTADVTPEMAAAWLETNENNRSHRKLQVAKYAKDMREGRWGFVADPIRFSDTGKLLDGQHRLRAIVESGVTIKIAVVEGLDPDTQQYMDSGIKRTVGDQMKIDGRDFGTRLAAAARQVMSMLERNVGGSMAHYSTPEVVQFCRDNPSIQDAVLLVNGISKVSGIRPAIAGGCAYFGNIMHPVATAKFFEDVMSGVGQRATSPALLLRNRLAVSERGVDAAVIPQTWLILHALNLYFEDITSHTRLQLPRGVRMDNARVAAELHRLLNTTEPDSTTGIQVAKRADALHQVSAA